MIVAIASGKGGTGKTTVSVNLAQVMEQSLSLLDCDVEEPNIHLFIKGPAATERTINIKVPEINEALCDGCGKCAKFCQFGAISCAGTIPLLFHEMCHGCGGCTRACPKKAIREIDKRIGIVKTSQAGHITLISGLLDVGVPLAPPLIRAVKSGIKKDSLIIMDSPPGTSCPVVATLHGADFAVLVTEPTPFGLHDLKLAVAVTREMKLPFGVIINRATTGDSRIHDYCRAEQIQILAEIPDDRRIAEALSKGKLLVEELPEYRPLFQQLAEKIMKRGAA